MFNNLMMGLQIAIEPFNLFLIAGGTFFGILVGAMPGMHASTVIILFTPITLYLHSIPAFLFSVAIYCGELFGGSITAILFRIPGTAAAIATTFDGYEMTKRGRAGEALIAAIYSSAFGGLLSVFALITIVPFLAKIALGFGPAEFFSLAVMGLSVISAFASKSLLKGTIMALWGLVIATIGMDNMVGVERLTFNFLSLRMGISFIIVLLGILPLAEVFKAITECFREGTKEKEKIRNITNKIKIPSFWFAIENLFKYRITFLKSSLIGTIIGILPGAGGTISSFLSYGEAVRSSKHPEQFGTGAIEGVIAPEAANNASSGGAMVPMLTLGIPGSETTAILLGLLVLHGLRPGPMLLIEAPNLVYSCFIGMIIANIFIIIMGVSMSKVFLKLLQLPKYFIYPGILLLCTIAAFNLRNSWSDVWMLFIFGIIGYFMDKYEWPVAPLVLGMVLGNLLEDSFRRALLIYDGDFFVFFKLPVSAILLIISVIFYLAPFVKMMKKSLNKKNA